jgi:hypothetical protein
MKVIELQEIIRNVIKEALNEDAAFNKAAQDAEKISLKKQMDALNKKKSDLNKDKPSPENKAAQDAQKMAIDKKLQTLAQKVNTLNKPGMDVLDLDEMANVSVRYQLAGDVNADDFKGKKNRIITAMKATGEPMAKIDVAGELGYDKQNPINSDFMELVASGVIEPAGEQKAPRLTRPASDKPKGGEGEEDFVTGDLSDEEVDAMFAKAKASGDDEPEIGDIEKSDVSAAKMSDEDYEAFMKVSDLENRLASTKSNILKLKKSKGAAGDISDKPSTELVRLRDLKASLEKRIDDIVASSKYLQQRQEKATGKKYEPINIEDVETEEPLDEWTKGRMQFYAGIKK